jgi:hypothetical protein
VSREVGREARILKRIIKEDLRRMRKEFPELFQALLAMGSPLAWEILEEEGAGEAAPQREGEGG